MNEASPIVTADPLSHVCPRHPTVALWNVLRGGSGFCRSCNLYVQAAGIPMPMLPPRPERVKVKTKKKAKRKKATKRNALMHGGIS